ncbi:Panacea domain-containing protein [uncultured Roseibium sp.]|uniref:Panacea domain-containing protein n=1 Tax=uncultured Roseibium sp. TaxID=1936171 RepID=UPI00260E521C|nr:Panacea domain-containing protein [uncultured Roseibium sp.]
MTNPISGNCRCLKHCRRKFVICTHSSVIRKGMSRLRFKWQKAIHAIDYIARERPGITQYYIGKILFFADREHFLDYGRAITGDRYVAMEHGPVPSAVRDMLKLDSGYPDEILDELDARITIEREGNKQHVYSKMLDYADMLSGSDKEYLSAAIVRYGSMAFGELKAISHEDPAYVAAWEEAGNANEMDIDLWLDQWLDEPETAKRQLLEQTAYSR